MPSDLNFPNRFRIYTEALCDRVSGVPAIEQISNFSDLAVIELALGNGYAPCLPIPRNLIPMVFGVRPLPQMGWVDAKAIVARMQYVEYGIDARGNVI